MVGVGNRRKPRRDTGRVPGIDDDPALSEIFGAFLLPPTTASSAPRAGDFQNKGLTALADASSSFNGVSMDVLTNGRKSECPKMA